MSFEDVMSKTKIFGYNPSDTEMSNDAKAILAALKYIYDGSSTARAMFENWIKRV